MISDRLWTPVDEGLLLMAPNRLPAWTATGSTPVAGEVPSTVRTAAAGSPSAPI